MALTRFPYGYSGTPAGMGTQLTWDQMMTKKTVNKLHPEFRRRLRAIMEQAHTEGIALGVGTGWRIQQRGPGFASPGNSYHEGFPADGVHGNALAADMVPNTSWAWLQGKAAAYGLRTFRTVNSEPWHLQPSEIPLSRKFATVCPPLNTFNLPGKAKPIYPLPTLRVGSTGTQVTMLIDHLKFWRWYPSQFMGDGNDGKFGARTEAGVKAMQTALKLSPVDGIYGPQTATKYRDFQVALSKLPA